MNAEHAAPIHEHPARSLALTALCVFSRAGALYLQENTQMSNRTHGKTTSSTYRSWHDMRQRCENPTDKQYPDYGGRGIRGSPRWSTFINFLADMGERPTGRSIDRIDNDGNYEPGNCRWATRTEQNRNTRRNVTVTYKGHTLCIAGWAELLGINYQTLLSRVKRGWSAEKIMTQPVRGSQ